MKNLLFLFVLLAFTSTTASSNNNVNANSLPSDTLKKGKNYFLFNKSKNVESVDFRKNKKSKDNIIYLRFGLASPIPTSNAVNATVISSKRYKEDGSLPVFDKIDILKGKYADVVMSKHSKIKNLFLFSGVEFPLRLKLHSDKEFIDLELTEAGEWNIEINLENN
ncbi:hypothetical protein [Pedobacter insulae]|uniref:Uncharacterized protein n=1 Tax=Pedobacter insulae TaxID=414048 RepID=A0A1I2ZM52_9SPHI|nr:hypothetical protein [Pedobacter insulae]SFH38804.1 hypothetical protein SAMN04489864_110137 [Pedobacter insulae]